MVRIGEDRTERLDYIPARYQVIVTVRPKYACPKGRTGVVQAKAPAHLLEGSWPTEPLLAQIAVSKHSEFMPLNRQALDDRAAVSRSWYVPVTLHGRLCRPHRDQPVGLRDAVADGTRTCRAEPRRFGSRRGTQCRL